MSDRQLSRSCALVLTVLAAACGHPEQRVVDQYFNAVNAQDNQTLSSFAAVKFSQKVDKWTITSVGQESKAPAPLPELVKKVKQIEAQIQANKKEANAYALENLAQVDRVRELQRKDAKIPPNLAAVAARWDEFNQKDRELKKAQAEAKDAADREKRDVQLSVGEVADIESLSGEVTTKPVELQLTLKGEPQNYTMGLKRYNLQSSGQTGRMMSRWVIHSLEPRK
jgi:septal ring factor EnvC (AmiA/AmiB activator)